jgi:hypothetical protein
MATYMLIIKYYINHEDDDSCGEVALSLYSTLEDIKADKDKIVQGIMDRFGKIEKNDHNLFIFIGKKEHGLTMSKRVDWLQYLYCPRTYLPYMDGFDGRISDFETWCNSVSL